MAEKEEFRYIVRVSNTDLDGKKHIVDALRKIKGVSYTYANALCQAAGVKRELRTGDLPDSDVAKIQAVLNDPKAAGFPTWLLNRRNDYETGVDTHLLTNDLTFTTDADKKRLQKIKSRRGMRLAAGLTVRGQRTRSNFRTNKGKKR